MGQENHNSDKLEIDDKGLRQAPISNPTNKDVFDFLSSLDGAFSRTTNSN